MLHVACVFTIAVHFMYTVYSKSLNNRLASCLEIQFVNAQSKQKHALVFKKILKLWPGLIQARLITCAVAKCVGEVAVNCLSHGTPYVLV